MEQLIQTLIRLSNPTKRLLGILSLSLNYLGFSMVKESSARWDVVTGAVLYGLSVTAIVVMFVVVTSKRKEDSEVKS